MRLALVVLVYLLIPAAALAQNRPQNIDVDEIVEVRLNEEGHRILRFRTEHTGRLRADIFSAPSATGAITVSFRERGASGEDGAGEAAPIIFTPGRYEAVVQAVNPGSAIIQMRVRVGIPLDEYESNDTRETATRVDLPFRGLIHLSSGDMDWFRVNPAAGGIIGVHLHTSYSYTGPQIGFYGSDGTEILVTDSSDWGARGMRYVRSTGRPIYIAVWDSKSFGEGDADVFKRLEIVQYSPQGAPASSRSLVTLGLEGEDPATFQLDLIGRAIGVETVAADEAESIARELREAIKGRGTNWRLIWFVLFAIVALGGAGYYYWQRQQKAEAPKSD